MNTIKRCGAVHDDHRCTSLEGHTGTHADLGTLSDGRFGFYEWPNEDAD